MRISPGPFFLFWAGPLGFVGLNGNPGEGFRSWRPFQDLECLIPYGAEALGEARPPLVKRMTLNQYLPTVLFLGILVDNGVSKEWGKRRGLRDPGPLLAAFFEVPAHLV